MRGRHGLTANNGRDGPTSMGSGAERALSFRGRIGKALLNAAEAYDLDHDTPAQRFSSGVAKLVCARCSEPRRPDAIVNGVCRNRRKCDDNLRV